MWSVDSKPHFLSRVHMSQCQSNCCYDGAPDARRVCVWEDMAAVPERLASAWTFDELHPCDIELLSSRTTNHLRCE